MRSPAVLSIALLLACQILFPVSANALSLGQIDTFESGTTEGWVVGLGGVGVHPAPPSNESTGGPGGAGDNFLLLTALGAPGPGGQLSVINASQWAGDYLAAGIGAISMMVNNFGPDDLHLRLVFEDPMMGPPSNVAFTNAIVVPSGSGWVSLTFGIKPSDLTAELGTVEAALSNATAIRIYHSISPEASSPGTTGREVEAQLGVDNIRALSVIPEPASAALFGMGLLVWAGRRVRSRAARP